MSTHVTRGAPPDSRKLQRPRLRRFDLGPAANDDGAGDRTERSPR